MSAALLVVFAQSAQAAVLYALPEKNQIKLGESFNVDIKINTEDVSINAVQTTARFPSSVIELAEADKETSAFNFWVEEPLISNEEGTLKFIGGTTKGVSGQTLQVIKMTFKAVSVGQAQITLNDAVITASDGTGKNVLSVIEGATVNVVSEITAPQAPPVIPSAPLVEKPQPVVREAAPAVGLPLKPKLRVPLYPDESRWYNHLGELIVFWEVPGDVVKVAAEVDKNPKTSPEKIEEELFTGKSFGTLKEGVWYIHVQFKNNIGWGEVAHYRVAIDTTPPVPFDAVIDQEVGDNPRPVMSYESFDGLSGIDKALIFVDNQQPIESREKSLTLPLQPPGKHKAVVKFSDKAGNSVEDVLEFEILPLKTPVIEFITKRVSREEPVFISGAGLPSVFVDLKVYKSGQEIIKETIQTDSAGKWGVSLKEPLLIGDYTVIAVARDDRGALSYPSEAEPFRIRPKTIVSLGPLDLGWFEIFIIIALFIISGLGFYGWYYLGIKRKREAYAIIVARDVEKMHDLLKENLEKLSNNISNLEKFISPLTKTIDPTLKEESLSFISRMREILDKIRKYVKKEVEGLK